MTFVFGGLLLLTAVRLGRRHGRPTPIEANPVLRLVRRVIPISDRYQGTAMLARERGRLVATPLLAAVILLNLIDVVFAVDSIPAVFSVTKDPFVAFTSNALAILGLRSLYFVVAGAVRSFAYLAPALAAVLAFVGTKMLLAPWIHVPAAVSLAITVGILAVGLLVSLVQRSGGFGAVRRRHRADRLSSPTTVTMILVVSALTVAILLIMAFEFVF